MSAARPPEGARTAGRQAEGTPANAARPPGDDPVPETPGADIVTVENLTMAFGPKLVQRDLNFTVRSGEIMVIMGGSGCGKSTLLRHMIGLQPPAKGSVKYGEIDLYESDEEAQTALRQRFGVMFQAGALWSSMSVGENVMLPMREFRKMEEAEMEHLARFKLALVGLGQSFDAEPASLSGGMRKRAAIARAMSLDPPLLYLDEPSAGLDPLTSARLDELILSLRDHLGTSVVMVTHELDSIFAVADRALFLDAKEKTMTAFDAPRALLAHGPEPVREFLRRGRPAEKAEAHPAAAADTDGKPPAPPGAQRPQQVSP